MRTISLFSPVNFLMVTLLLTGVGCNQGTAPDQQQSAANQASTSVTTAANTANSEPQINAEELMTKVKQYFEAGNYRAAFPLLDQLHAAKVCPAEGYAIRAQILDHSGLLSQAIASLTVALTKEKENADWHNMLGLLFVKSQNMAMAQQAFTRAVELKPEFAKAYNNRGLMFIARKEFGPAINDFNQALQQDSEYLDAFNNRGFAYLQQGNYAKAIENFTAAISKDPNYVKGYNNRGFAFMKIGDAEKAAEDFTKAIELAPDTVKHYLHRRDARLAMGQQTLADEDQATAQWVQQLLLINRKIERDAQDVTGWLERAEHFANVGKYDEAFADFSEAEKRDESECQVHCGRARIYLERKQYQAAIDSCTKALEFEETFEARSLRGDAYLATGKLDLAIADYSSAQRFDQSVAIAYWERAAYREKEGDKDGAKADRETALKLNPELDEATTTK